MKTKNMKKALSIFLAVLMIALALPFTLLSVSADEAAPTATTIANVESTKGAKTSGGVTYSIDRAFDGDFTTCYLGNGESSFQYGVTDGVFGDGSTYRDYITVELSALSDLRSVTLWANDEEESKSFANNNFDVYYSVDGENWELFSEHRNVCGNGSTTGAGFADYTEQRDVYWASYDNSYTHYGLKLNIDDVAKYVRIAVIKGRVDNGWMTLYEVEVEGTEVAIPVSVAGIQQNANGDVRLVGATDSLKAEGVGFKLDITHTYEEAADSIPASIKNVTFLAKKTGSSSGDVGFRGGSGVVNSYDGNLTTVAQSYGFSSYFPTYYLDSNNAFKADTTTAPKDGGLGKYYAIFVVELNELSVLEDMTLWSRQNTDGGRAHTNFANDAYDIYYSADGTSYTAVSGASFTGMTGDGTNAGANSALYSEERTVSENVYYGHKIDMKDAAAKYVAIAVTSPTKGSNKDTVLREVEFGGNVVSDTVTVTKTATYTTEATDTVYNSILADGENVTAKDINASYSDAHKLYALGITGIPQNGTVELEVTPYFIPVGTDIKFYGDAATFEFIDGKATNYSETVKVMSYNICNGQVNNKTLSQRLDYIAAQINSVDPDVVVLNEAHNFDAEHPTYDIAISSLTAKCDVNYGIVEYPDKESKNVVLYNTAKYTLVSSEVIDLPNESQDGTESAAYARTAVFARLKRISDNREFVVSAIHFDYVKSVAKMQAWAVNGHLAENYADVRQIVAGDFNIVGTSSTVHINPFVNEGYVNANTESDATATYPEGAEGENVIDFIYSKDFKASDYTVVNAENASAASDHRAIYAELTLN